MALKITDLIITLDLVTAALADPGNAEYLLKTQKHGWDLLDALMEQDLIECLGYALPQR